MPKSVCLFSLHSVIHRSLLPVAVVVRTDKKMWVKLPYRFSKAIFSRSRCYIVLHTISFLFVRLVVSCLPHMSIRTFFYQEIDDSCIVPLLAFQHCFLLVWKDTASDKKGQFSLSVVRVLFEKFSILIRLQLLGDNFVLCVYYPGPCIACMETRSVQQNSAVLLWTTTESERSSSKD